MAGVQEILTLAVLGGMVFSVVRAFSSTSGGGGYNNGDYLTEEIDSDNDGIPDWDASRKSYKNLQVIPQQAKGR